MKKKSVVSIVKTKSVVMSMLLCSQIVLAQDPSEAARGSASEVNQVAVSLPDTRSEEQIKAIIKSEIATISDFPKSGIVFRDMTPLLSNPEVFQIVIDLFAQRVRDLGIDVVAGLDARGFLLGTPLALQMKKPFIPVRKKGKLPKPTHNQRYTTEYSVDEIEISTPSLFGKTILIVDDLLATGGTLGATEALFLKAGASRIYSICLIELQDLKGREKLQFPTFSLVQY